MIKDKLKEHNIPSAVNYSKSLCEYPVYQEKGRFPNEMKNSKKVSREVLCLPMHPYLEEPAIARIAKVVNSCFL